MSVILIHTEEKPTYTSNSLQLLPQDLYGQSFEVEFPLSVIKSINTRPLLSASKESTLESEPVATLESKKLAVVDSNKTDRNISKIEKKTRAEKTPKVVDSKSSQKSMTQTENNKLSDKQSAKNKRPNRAKTPKQQLMNTKFDTISKIVAEIQLKNQENKPSNVEKRMYFTNSRSIANAQFGVKSTQMSNEKFKAPTERIEGDEAHIYNVNRGVANQEKILRDRTDIRRYMSSKSAVNGDVISSQKQQEDKLATLQKIYKDKPLKEEGIKISNREDLKRIEQSWNESKKGILKTPKAVEFSSSPKKGNLKLKI